MVAATVVLVGCGVPAGIASADPPTPPPQPKTTIDHDGTYTVGTDIVAGTYSSAGPADGGVCYWKRLGNTDGKDIIDNAMTKKPQVVRIDASDKAFKTDGCQPWQMSDAAPPEDMPASAAGGILNGLGGLLGGGQVPGP